MSSFSPAYLPLLESGELEARVALAQAHMTRCDLCPWECHKDRTTDRLGVCQTGARARVASFGPHFSEEAVLTGWNGSGTVFFAQCNLRCQFCQNSDISQFPVGDEVDPPVLAEIFLALQRGGCHNINLVTPSHVVAQILAAVVLAARAGLRLPLVYNTGGYDALVALKLLDGVVDIYMPDMKYSSPQTGLHYSKVRNYPQVNQAAVKEMHRQVGDLQVDDNGQAQRGLLVRHLVLPYGLAGTPGIARFLSEEISKDTYLNVMDQYHPAHLAALHPRLNRRLQPQEFAQAVAQARAAGLTPRS